MERKRSGIAMALAAALAAAALAGCSKEKEAPKITFDNVEITVLAQDQGMAFNGQDINLLLDSSKELVERENPGLKVNVVRVPFEQYEEKIKELKPDVYWVSPADIALPKNAGKLADLNPILGAQGLDPKNYFSENLLGMLTADGKLLGLPMSAYDYAVGYSKSLFESAGLPEPNENWTWDEFAADAIALKAANSESVTAAGLPFYSDFIETLVMSRGGSFLSPDGTQTSGYMDGPASVAAVEWLTQLYEQGLVKQQFGEVSMIGQSFGMAVSLTPMLNHAASSNPDIGIVPLPVTEGVPRASAPYVTALAVNANSAHPEAAIRYIHALTMADNEVTSQGFTLGLSVSKPAFDNADKTVVPGLAVNYELTRYAQPRSTMRSNVWPVAMAAFSGTFPTMIQTEMDAQATLTQMAQSIDGKLAEAQINEQREAEQEKAAKTPDNP